MKERRQTRIKRRIRTRAWLVLALPLCASVGCASGQSECHAETWSGTCQLVQVNKIRQSEFPLPSVTLEAIYRPQPGPDGPTLVPEDQRKEFAALDRYEDALRAHLEANKSPRCFINPPPPGQCHPGAFVVEVPAFDATRADASQANNGPKGCAQIEATSAQDRVASAKVSQTVINERFEFAEQASDLQPEASATLDALAARLKAAPNLQCVGVVGAWIRGENVALAFARSRAVRDQLIARGVEPERLIALTVDPPTLSASSAAEPPDPKARRVTLSVLLDLPPNK